MHDQLRTSFPAPRFEPPTVDAQPAAVPSNSRTAAPTPHPLDTYAAFAGGLAFIFTFSVAIAWLLEVFSRNSLGDMEFILFLNVFPVLSALLSIAAIVLALLALNAGNQLLWPGLTLGFAALTLSLSWTLLGSYSPVVIYFFQDTGVLI